MVQSRNKEWWRERAARGGTSGEKSYNAPYVFTDKWGFDATTKHRTN